jgi:hypothetical protein
LLDQNKFDFEPLIVYATQGGCRLYSIGKVKAQKNALKISLSSLYAAVPLQSTHLFTHVNMEDTKFLLGIIVDVG